MPRSSSRSYMSRGSIAVARSRTFSHGEPQKASWATRRRRRSGSDIFSALGTRWLASAKASAAASPPMRRNSSRMTGAYSSQWPSASMTGWFSRERSVRASVAPLLDMATPPGNVRSGLLDRAEPERVGTDRPHEGPELFELHRLGPAALQDSRAALVGREVQQAGQEVHGDVVLAALLPGLGDLGRAHGDVLQPVDPALGAELVAVALHDALHLGHEQRRDAAHVARHPRRLHSKERVRRAVGHRLGTEAGIHLADVAETAFEIDGAGDGGRRRLAPVLRARLPAWRVAGRGVAGRCGRLPAAAHVPDREPHEAADDQDLEDPEAAAVPAAEEETADQAADEQAAQHAADPAPARGRWLRRHRRRRGPARR